jgi:diacylglycerol kinase (ATP)
LSPFAGGSMKLIPHAPQRGNQLAITRVEKVSKWKVIRNILNLYSGNLAHIPEVNLSFATNISILSAGLNVQIDGELSGQTPIQIELVPTCFYVMKPSEL